MNGRHQRSVWGFRRMRISWQSRSGSFTSTASNGGVTQQRPKSRQLGYLVYHCADRGTRDAFRATLTKRDPFQRALAHPWRILQEPPLVNPCKLVLASQLPGEDQP